MSSEKLVSERESGDADSPPHAHPDACQIRGINQTSTDMLLVLCLRSGVYHAASGLDARARMCCSVFLFASAMGDDQPKGDQS